MVIRDSRYCWFLAAIGHINMAMWAGVLNTFGIFFVEFVNEFDGKKSSIAWLGSGACGINMLLGPLASYLRAIFGDQVTIAFGTSVCALSLLVSSFITQWQLLFLTYTVFYGFGCSLLNICINNIPAQYFDKQLSLALGVVISGNGVGIFVLSFVGQILINALGWRNTWRVFAGILALLAPTGCLYKPPEKRENSLTSLNKLESSLPLYKNRVYIIWLSTLTLVMLGYYVPFVYLVSYAISLGISQKRSSLLLSVLGISDAIGRVLIGKVINLGILNHLHTQQMAMIVGGSATMLLTIMTSYGWLLFYAVLLGLVDACYMILLPIMTSSFTGFRRLSTALGFIYGSISITTTLGPPIAGWLYEYTESYSVPFHISAIPCLLGCVILFFLPWAQRTTAKTTSEQKTFDQLVMSAPPGNFCVLSHVVETQTIVDVNQQAIYNQEICIDMAPETNFVKDDLANKPLCTEHKHVQTESCEVKDENVGQVEVQFVQDKYNEPSLFICNNEIGIAVESLSKTADNVSSQMQCVKIPDSVVEVLENLAKKEEPIQPETFLESTELILLHNNLPGGMVNSVEVPNNSIAAHDYFSNTKTREQNLPSCNAIFNCTPKADGDVLYTKSICITEPLIPQLNNFSQTLSSERTNLIELNTEKPITSPLAFDNGCWTPDELFTPQDTYANVISVNTIENTNALQKAPSNILPILELINVDKANSNDNVDHFMSPSANEVNMIKNEFGDIQRETDQQLQCSNVQRKKTCSLSAGIEENFLFGQNSSNDLALDCHENIKTESETTNILDLAAENIAKFEEDLGIISNQNNHDQVDHNTTLPQSLDTYKINLVNDFMSAADTSMCDDILISKHKSVITSPQIPFDMEPKAANTLDTEEITISDLVAENIAQFDGNLKTITAEQ